MSPANPSSSPFSLRIQSYPELVVDSRRVALEQRRAWALLAYLSERGAKVARAQAAALLWPDADAALGRTRLRRLVYQINSAAGTGVVGGNTDAVWVGLDGPALVSDVAAVRAQAQVLLTAPGSEIPPLAQAVLLDPGAAQLLDGFTLDADSFCEWLAQHRAEHERLVARALQRLADLLLGARQSATTVMACESLLRLDGCNEAAHATRIQALAQLGDMAGVEMAYFRCADTLRAELGIRPSAQVEQAYVAALQAQGGNVLAPSTPAAHAQPRIRFAQTADGTVAYSVHGAGTRTMVVVPGLLSHVEVAFEEPRIRQVLEWLGARYQVVLLDRRGIGLSERMGVQPTAQSAIEDIVAVLDALGVDKAWILGASVGGTIAIEMGATRPERVVGLLLYGTNARGAWAADYPWALTDEALERWLELLRSDWGGATSLEAFAPSVANDAQSQAWWARMLRHAASPNSLVDIIRAFHAMDMRAMARRLRVPVLVLQREDDRVVRAGAAKHLAELVPGARLVMLPGADHFLWCGDREALLGEIEAFVAAHG